MPEANQLPVIEGEGEDVRLSGLADRGHRSERKSFSTNDGLPVDFIGCCIEMEPRANTPKYVP